MKDVNKYLFVALCALGMAIKTLMENNDKLIEELSEETDFILEDNSNNKEENK